MNALSKDLSPAVASLDGLDTLFESAAEVLEQAETLSEADTTHDVDSVLTWSLQDAADNLGLSKRTILRRLKTGALLGQKITGNFGPEWRITPPDNMSTTVIPSSHPVNPSDNNPQDRTLDQALSKYAEHLLQLVEEKNVLLLQLSQKNGYLQAQLESKQETIKLLEDRARISWWRRAWSWFTSSRE